MSTTTDGYDISRPKRQLRCPGCSLSHEEHEFGEPGKFCDGPGASISALGVEKHMVKESGHENEVGIKLKKETDTHNGVKLNELSSFKWYNGLRTACNCDVDL